jgi:hypothetical protein
LTWLGCATADTEEMAVRMQTLNPARKILVLARGPLRAGGAEGERIVGLLIAAPR